jgi:hypothetical protein
MMVSTQARRLVPSRKRWRKRSALSQVFLHQVESPLPIVSELAGVTTKNRKQGHQIGLKSRPSRHFSLCNRLRPKGPASKPMQPG